VGAFAERIKFSAMLLFSLIWVVFVCIPVCHMTWAGPGGLFFDWGVIDLAGGIVVHITAGFSALVACILVGPRKGFPDRMDPPHNLTLTTMGTAMLWVGWFGFNGGSVLAANGQAAMTVLVTHLSACSATLVWMSIEWIKLGKPSVLGASTGSIAGLAAITPASGVVGPFGAIIIGALSGGLCFVFATMIKRKFQYDDTLDVFGVHGVGGFLGTILAGVFASAAFGGNKGDLNILQQTGIQTIAAVGTAVYSMAVSLILLVLIKKSIGLRVEGVSEDQGLDLSEHEERGYNFL
jgi:ammonium transporter, Amt family